MPSRVPLRERMVVTACLSLAVPATCAAAYLGYEARQLVMAGATLLTALGLAWLASVQRSQVDRRFVRFMSLQAVMAAIQVLGAGIWLATVIVLGYPSTGTIDALSVLAYLPLIGSIACIARPGLSRSELMRLVLDALVLLVGGSVILWSALGTFGDLSPLGFCFLVLDLALVSALVSLMAQRHTARFRRGVVFLLAGMLIGGVADGLLMIGRLDHPVIGASWSAVLGVIQGGLFAFAVALAPRGDPLPVADPFRLQRGQATSLIITLLVTMIAVAAGSRSQMSGVGVSLSLLLVAGLVAGLVAARLLIDQRDLRRALIELNQANRAMEARVEARTADLRVATSAHQLALEAEAEERRFGEVLRDVVQTVANAEDLRAALQAVLAGVRGIAPVSASGIMFVEDGVARTVCHDGYAERGLAAWIEALNVPIDAHPPLQRLYHHGEIQLQNDTRAMPEWGANPELAWVGSYLGAPLRARGRTYGFLNLLSERSGAFTPAHGERLRAVAQSIALALENARLLARTRRRLERLGLLLEVSTGLNRDPNLATGLRDAVWRFGQAADLGALLILGGPAEAPWRPIAVHGLPAEEGELAIEGGVLAEVGLLGGDWTVISRPADDLRLATPALGGLRRVIAAHGREMLVVVPLRMRERLHGVLLAMSDRDLSTSDGELLRILGAAVTARIESDHRLDAERTARATAEEASRLKGEFLANTSHELRTPLTGILLALELALEPDLDDDRSRAELIDTALHSGRRLLTTINGLLDLAKIEAGHLDVHAERLDVERAVTAAVAPLLALAERRRVIVVIAGWTDGDPAHVWADPALLHQILTNLLGNALKFTEDGTLTVTLSAAVGRVRIRIADTGVGISPEQLNRLFRPFVQGDGSSTRRFEGTGLGLVIARRMAEHMGGSLILGSEGPGRGTVALVELPTA